MLQNVTTSILHLSDLHLGKSFADVGSDSKADGLSKETINSFRENYGFVMQTHDSYIIPCLENEILMAARYIGAREDKFDFHVVSGDITAHPSPVDRFQFARDYLIDSVQLPETPGGGSGRVGLRLAKNSLFCVPGNHDKLALEDRNAYLTGFRDLPDVPPYVKEVFGGNQQRLLFYGLDSNLYKEGNLAVGEIAPQTLSRLGEYFTLTQTPEDPSTVRILVLHHHPADLNRYRPRSLSTLVGFFTGGLSTLKEGSRLLKACEGKIDLIMHGHEHFPVVFFEPTSSSVVLSAGSTSAFLPKGKGVNSFHTIALADREFQIVQFDWNGARFIPSKESLGNLDDRAQLTSRKL